MNVSFTRRRALVALLVVGLASAAAGMGTMAYFSDTEQSTDNTVSAGTLDLVAGGDNQVVNVTPSDVKPGWSTTVNETITNDGTIDGELDLSINQTGDAENTVIESEPDSDDNSSGELAENLEVKIYVEYDNGSTAGVTGWTDLSSVTDSDLETNVSLAAGEQADFNIEMQLPGSSTGNVVQSDGVTFDIELSLDQQSD